MPIHEVWEYGNGHLPRNRYQTVSEEHAIRRFLDRPLVSGKTYRDHLAEQEQDRLLLCVKDPTEQGTQDDPNYPSVYVVELTED